LDSYESDENDGQFAKHDDPRIFTNGIYIATPFGISKPRINLSSIILITK
jgi:hypothetical protein